MERKQLALKIYHASHLTGRFVLRSGQTSGEYFDKYLFESEPALLKEIAVQMACLIPADSQLLAGLEMGGIPIATALSLQTGLPVVFVRKKAKEYGTCKLAEGMDFKDRKLCIIEDVITTGGQVTISAGDLRSRGAQISHVCCVILRNPEGFETLKKEGLNLSYLFTMNELKLASGNQKPG